MSAINEILASGQYTDRRGREWVHKHKDGRWFYEPDGPRGIDMMHSAQMRLRIERDQHKDVCPGLRWCLTHPVASVDRNRLSKSWQVWGPGDWHRTSRGTHAEAMDAARALAVNP